MKKMGQNIDEYFKAVKDAASFIKKHLGEGFLAGIITGTGLGEFAGSLEKPSELLYTEIPGFPVSTVESHAGRLVSGMAAGVPVILMQGRVHLYEGYTARDVAFPVRVMQALGVRNLVVTNAAGGLNRDFNPGDLMLIKDHVNLTGENPLVGPNPAEWGLRFPDMSDAYSRRLRDLARKAAGAIGIHVREGVYAGLKGPSLETPAEIRYLMRIGADAVGLSTVCEVIAAVHARMNVLGISVITNSHDPENPAPATLEEIVEVAENSAGKLVGLVMKSLERLREPGN